MITNKYILQRIFNNTFHSLEICDLKRIRYTLIRLLLISKQFRYDVLRYLYYPKTIIYHEEELECAYNLIKASIPLKLVIEINNNLEPSTLLDKFKDKAKSVFDLTEKALWNEISPHVHSFVSFNNREVKGNANFCNLQSIEIVNRYQYSQDNPLLRVVNSRLKRNNGIGGCEFPFLNRLDINQQNSFLFKTLDEIIPRGIMDKVTVLSISLKADSLQSFDFISQIKNLKTFSYRNRYLDFQNLFENVNAHQSLDSLFLEFQETKANQGYHDVPFIPFSFLLKNNTLTSLSMKFKDIPIEIVDLLIKTNRNLKTLIITDSQYGERQPPVDTLLEPRIDYCKIENTSLTHFTMIKSKYKFQINWITPSDLKSLCIDQLSPLIFKNHPKLESAEFICGKGIMNLDHSIFLSQIALNQTLVTLTLDLTTTFYTKQPNYPPAIEFLVNIFNALTSTNIRHFNFTVRESKNGVFQEYSQELVPAIKKNKNQLYSLTLRIINPNIIYPTCHVLESILEKITSLQKFETNERIKVSQHQCHRLKSLIASNSNLKILNIPNVCMDEYINLDSFIINSGIFCNYDSKYLI